MKHDTAGYPALSVIVPVYNAEKYLVKCLDSMIGQTFQDMEIILVNDGSTDGSLAVCREYERKDKRIKIISKENGGLIRARKSGLSAAKGKLVGFADSDDWIEPQMYEQLITCMVESGSDMVSSGIIREYGGSGQSVTVYDAYPEGLYDDLEKSIYPTMLFHKEHRNFGLYCTLVNKIYKKELLDRVYEQIEEDVFYGEDALACYPYCLLSKRIYILHKAFYHYNIRNDSMCFLPDERLAHNSYLLYRGLASAFQKEDCSFLLMAQLKKYVMSLERHTLSALYQIDAVAFDEWHFSFPEKYLAGKFAVYGAGTCGQAFYRNLCDRKKEQNMAFWVDKHAELKREACAFPIQKPDVLEEGGWEIVLIAVQNENLAHEIKEELVQTYQIERERIVWSRVEHIPVWELY